MPGAAVLGTADDFQNIAKGHLPVTSPGPSHTPEDSREPIDNGMPDVRLGTDGGLPAVRTRRVFLAVATALVLTVAVSILVGFKAFSFVTPPSSAAPIDSPGSPSRFAYLAAQRSNSCGLQPEIVMSYDDSDRLQGSCCNPMDMAKYEWQVSGLRRYADIDAVPVDPYDIPVSLAKRLLGYERSIALDAGQQRTFDDAMRQTRDGAPCCCQCWRWHTTTGLAKYLIVARGVAAVELAKLVDLLNGCGGPLEPSSAYVERGRT